MRTDIVKSEIRRISKRLNPELNKSLVIRERVIDRLTKITKDDKSITDEMMKLIDSMNSNDVKIAYTYTYLVGELLRDFELVSN